MGSKVKARSTEKNIDIEINIENNLFSKNKGCGKEYNDKKGKKKDNIPQVEIGEKYLHMYLMSMQKKR